MSRRAVDVIAASRDPEGRQYLWDEIRGFEGACFTHADLNRATLVNRRTVSSYLGCLVAGGYLERFEEGPVLRWRQLRDSYHAPRLRPDGSPVISGGGTANMWRSMRMLAQFTPRDLAAHSTTQSVSVTEATAKRYIGHLLAAGYLRVIQKAKPRGRQATYRLIRNTGPQPPMIQRVHQVYDPNDGKVYAMGASS